MKKTKKAIKKDRGKTTPRREAFTLKQWYNYYEAIEQKAGAFKFQKEVKAMAINEAQKLRREIQRKIWKYNIQLSVLSIVLNGGKIKKCPKEPKNPKLKH